MRSRSEERRRRLRRERRRRGSRPTAARRSRRSAARRAATTTTASGSIRTTRTSSSSPPIRARSSRSTAARRGAPGTTSRPRRCYHVNADNAFPYRVCGGQQESGSACVREPRRRRRDHVPRVASGRRRGIWLRRPRSARSRHHLRRQDHRATTAAPARCRTSRRSRCAAATTARVRTAPVVFSPVDPHVALLRRRTRSGRRRTAARAGRRSAPTSRARRGTCRRASASYVEHAAGEADAARRDLRARAVAARHQPHLGRHRRRPDSRHARRRQDVERRHAAAARAVGEGLDHRGVALRRERRRTPRSTRFRLDDLRPHIYRTRDGGKTWTADRRAASPTARSINVVREDPKTTRAALRRQRDAGLVLVRRRRPLAVAAPEHAGDRRSAISSSTTTTSSSARTAAASGSSTTSSRCGRCAAACRGDAVQAAARVRASAGTRTPTRRCRPTSRRDRTRPTARSSITTCRAAAGAGDARDPRRDRQPSSAATRAPIQRRAPKDEGNVPWYWIRPLQIALRRRRACIASCGTCTTRRRRARATRIRSPPIAARHRARADVAVGAAGHVHGRS